MQLIFIETRQLIPRFQNEFNNNNMRTYFFIETRHANSLASKTTSTYEYRNRHHVKNEFSSLNSDTGFIDWFSLPIRSLTNSMEEIKMKPHAQQYANLFLSKEGTLIDTATSSWFLASTTSTTTS